jgi:hypothetical protein
MAGLTEKEIQVYAKRKTIPPGAGMAVYTFY